jgi:hypothetical protein
VKILRGISTNAAQPLTSPFPLKNGVFFELRGGDICEPVGFNSNWFEPPFPSRVIRKFCAWRVLPFLSWKFGTWGGYIGFKAYGVDSPIYQYWLCPYFEVYPGSVALCLSARPFATLAP